MLSKDWAQGRHYSRAVNLETAEAVWRRGDLGGRAPHGGPSMKTRLLPPSPGHDQFRMAFGVDSRLEIRPLRPSFALHFSAWL